MLSSSSPELLSSMTASVPPATGRIVSPTTTAPPTPTPTTIHPTWALTVWPSLTVNVFEALTSVGVIVGFEVVVELVVVVAGGGEDLGVPLGLRSDPLELSDFDSWLLVVSIVGMTVGFELDAGIFG